MLRKLLLPLDGSLQAEAILPHAMMLASAFGTQVDLLHVVAGEEGARPGGPADPFEYRVKRAEGASYLAEKAAELEAAGVEVIASRVEEGGAAEVIVALLRNGAYDAVGLTPHGAGQWRYLSIGCTAVAVILNAQTSVLLVPDAPRKAGEPPPSPAAYRRILAPVDCSPRSDWAVGVAAAIARRSGARLQLVHVLLAPEVVNRHPSIGDTRKLADRVVEANRTEAQKYLDDTIQRHGTSNLSVEGLVLSTEAGPAEAVRAHAEDEEIDLVILSAHGRGISTAWPLGGTATKLVFQARKPVLLLQDLPQEGRLREASPGAGRALAGDLRASR